jgi:hypothetical protein
MMDGSPWREQDVVSTDRLKNIRLSSIGLSLTSPSPETARAERSYLATLRSWTSGVSSFFNCPVAEQTSVLRDFRKTLPARHRFTKGFDVLNATIDILARSLCRMEDPPFTVSVLRFLGRLGCCYHNFFGALSESARFFDNLRRCLDGRNDVSVIAAGLRMVGDISGRSYRYANQFRQVFDIVFEFSDAWKVSPGDGERTLRTLNPGLYALDAMTYWISLGNPLPLRKLFQRLWRYMHRSLDDPHQTAIVSGCIDVFVSLIRANAPGTFHAAVDSRILEMVDGLLISDSANLKLGALKLLEICHSVGDHYVSYFIETGPGIAPVSHLCASESVELRVQAVNCVAAMLCARDLEELDIKPWAGIVEALQAGTFREIQAFSRLLFAYVPLVGDREFDIEVPRLVRAALDVIAEGNQELCYYLIGALIGVHRNLERRGALELFYQEFDAQGGRHMIVEKCVEEGNQEVRDAAQALLEMLAPEE